MMAGDIFHIKVTLLHQSDWTEEYQPPEYVQETHHNWWLPDSPIRLDPDQVDQLIGDAIERKARIAIDMLLDWRRENHTHDNSDPNPAA